MLIRQHELAVWLCAVFCLTFFAHAIPLHAQPIVVQDTQSDPSTLGGYPPDLPSDIAWSANVEGWSDVVAAYNYARTQENALLGTSLPPLTFPDAPTWEAMSIGEKALWLVNEERSARGLAPLQALEQNVAAVAQVYAELLLAESTFAHDADGRSPWERLDDNAAIGACHDFLGIAENLYLRASSGPEPLPLIIEQALYRMLYEDAGANWGHRHAILWTPYSENSGAPDREGFLGIGYAQGGYTLATGQFFQSTEIIVMNFFDPCATWVDAGQGTPEPSPSPSPTLAPTPVLPPVPTSTPTSFPIATPTPSPVPTSPSPTSPSPTSPSPTSSPTPTETPSRSQPTRFVSGRVTLPPGGAQLDASGIAGVTIASQTGQTAQTDANGEFKLAGLSPQKHTLSASRAGYKFMPEMFIVDLAAGDLSGIAFVSVAGPTATELSYSLHLPLILPAR